MPDALSRLVADVPSAVWVWVAVATIALLMVAADRIWPTDKPMSLPLLAGAGMLAIGRLIFAHLSIGQLGVATLQTMIFFISVYLGPRLFLDSRRSEQLFWVALVLICMQGAQMAGSLLSGVQ